jgi:hypothetical protein
MIVSSFQFPTGLHKRARAQAEPLLPSYQSRDTPSEILGGALRVNIRETKKQGRGSIITDRPIRQCFPVQALFSHARNKPTI